MGFNLSKSWEFEDKQSKDITYTNYFTSLKDPSKTWDIVQMGADFYLGFAIVNKGLVKFPQIKILHPNDVEEPARILKLTKKEIDKRNKRYVKYMENSPSVMLQSIIDSFSYWYNDFVVKVDSLFIDYASAAIGGELRHHQNVLDLGKGGTGEDRHIAWSRWARIHQTYGDEIFETAQALFLDFPDGSYGGSPWANAASLLLKRKRFELAGTSAENQMLFVDRVFNMQHNTGSFLNKLSWANFRDGDTDSVHNIHETVLAAHGANPPNIDVLLSKSSDYVKSTVKNILKIAQEHNLEVNGIVTN